MLLISLVMDAVVVVVVVVVLVGVCGVWFAVWLSWRGVFKDCLYRRSVGTVYTRHRQLIHDLQLHPPQAGQCLRTTFIR